MRTRWRTKKSANITNFYRTDWDGNRFDVNQLNPVVSIEFMHDDLHDFKQIGKTLNDIGGPLDLYRVSMDLDSWKAIYSCSFGDGRGPGESDIWIPRYGDAFSGTADGNRLKQAVNLLLYGVSDEIMAGLDENEVLAGLQWWIPDFAISSDMDSLGTTAISRCIPTNPSVDVATAVAELISERKFFSLPGTNQGLSGEWLNWSLGIAPSYSFAKDLRDTMESAEIKLKQYERDAGRLVRREYRYDVERSTKHEYSSSAWTGIGAQQGPLAYTSVGGNWETTLKSTKKVWFNGAFTYALPEQGWRRTLSELDQLYGIVPGVETAWELLPFSFVADYFANIGDVLSNINAFASDGLVMPYGYIMEHTSYAYELSGGFNYYPTGQGSGSTFRRTMNVLIERKRRQPANPFGFGLTPDGLTARQWSILAALGINLVS